MWNAGTHQYWVPRFQCPHFCTRGREISIRALIHSWGWQTRICLFFASLQILSLGHDLKNSLLFFQNLYFTFILMDYSYSNLWNLLDYKNFYFRRKLLWSSWTSECTLDLSLSSPKFIKCKIFYMGLPTWLWSLF